MKNDNIKIKKVTHKNWNKPRLKSLINKFASKRILVIGDVGVDKYLIGTVERISPEAPVPIVLVENEKLKLGLAANVADNVKTLGGEALLCGVIGKDRFAEDFKLLLKKNKISDSFLVTDTTRRTVVKERIVSERQQLLRVDFESLHEINDTIKKSLLNVIKKSVKKSDAVILEDYAKGMLNKSLANEIFKAASNDGKIIAVDPNSKTSAEVYYGSTLLTPNTKEAEQLAGFKINDETSLCAAGYEILNKTGAKHVVITRGKDGMAIFSSGVSTVTFIPTYAREVYDVSGAGDTVISVLALALSAGATIEEASIIGNLAAGVEVGKRGTATVTCEEILTVMDFFS